MSLVDVGPPEHLLDYIEQIPFGGLVLETEVPLTTSRHFSEHIPTSLVPFTSCYVELRAGTSPVMRYGPLSWMFVACHSTKMRTIPGLLSAKTQLPRFWNTCCVNISCHNAGMRVDHTSLANGIAGGIEALVHTIRGELESHSDHSLIALDSANGFNSLSPHSAYEAVVKHPMACQRMASDHSLVLSFVRSMAQGKGFFSSFNLEKSSDQLTAHLDDSLLE
jgi:hypothetical protein